MSKKASPRKKIFNILRILISVGLLVFLLSFLNVDQIWKIASRLWEEHPSIVLLIVLASLLFVVLEAFRLQQVLKIQEIDIPLSRMIRYCFIGVFFNNFMPTTIGGDVVKGIYISRDSGKKVEPFVALVAVRLIGGVCLTALTVIALIFGYDLLPNKTPVVMVALLVLGFLFMLFFFTRRKLAGKFLVVLKPFKSKRLRRNVIEVYRLFHSHKHFPLQISLATLATLGIELLIIFLNFLVARGMGYPDVSFFSFLLLIPLIAVITLVPSLNGLGVREGAYVYFFAPLIGKEAAGALSLIMLSMIVFLGLTGGLVFLISGSIDKAKLQPPSEEDFEEKPL